MKIGLFITNQQHLDVDMVSALEDQYVMVRYARDRGWHYLISGQHYLNEGDNKQLQLLPFMARLQAEAGEMTLGLGVMLLTLHNPVYVAEAVATLDVICRGNFVFGVGLGYREMEFDAFGVRKGTRVKRFEECLNLVQELWTGKPVTHDSELCTLNEVVMNIQPIQKPHPPIWFAANNEKAVRRAARMGDTWFINPHSTTDTVAELLEVFKAERQKAGKPMPQEIPQIKEIFCAKDRKTAIAQAGPYLAAKYATYAKWGQDKYMPGGESFEQDFESLLDDRFVLGSPEECYEQLRPYWEKLGVNTFIFRTEWSGMPLSVALQNMRMISDELMPELLKVKA